MDDLISRAAAIDAIVSATAFPDAEYIKNLCQNPANSEDWLGGVCDAINAVEDVNTVDAVPVVHGIWIECYERSRHYYCSNCGKVQGIASIVMKYCPEYGAKMAEHPWAGRYADQSGAEYADNPTV